ncbi:MAG: adenylate/guanylate cyclase domain-containing protein, partial [Nitriliruptor sp.]|uniref:adenylate/guanylate cyclase domain-containing protein n=1 Tax=Nitriliruptor sp. TaxID=2448056 RepID=UPI0034A0A17C
DHGGDDHGGADRVGGDRGPDDRGPRLELADLTGELPRFVRDRLGRPRPVGADGRAVLDDEDAATVRALVDLGLDEEGARAAVDDGRVALVLAQQVVGGPHRYTIAEVSEGSGVPVELLRRIRVATGLPLPERLGEADLQWARLLARLLEVLPPGAVASSARARGTALAMVARSDLGIVRDELLLPMRQAGADDLTVAVTLADTAKELDGIAREILQLTYGLHLEHQLSTELSVTLTRADVPEIDLAVGFVDVVGWTSLSSRIDPQGLDEVLDAFEDRIIEVTAPRTEVSVVKFLGDAAMLVAADAVTLAEAMMELTTAVPALEDVPLRGGLAAGPTLVREGDVFGPPVNLAARLTDLARPWRLLADEQLSDQLEAAGYGTRRLRPVRIRGVGTRRPVSVTSRSAEA